MIKFTLTDIISLETQDKKRLVYWEFVESKPIKRFFGLWNTGKFTKEGYINNLTWEKDIYTAKELENYYYRFQIIDNKVYIKPSLEITLSSGKIFIEYYDTLLDVYTRRDRLEDMSKNKFVTLRNND